MIIRVESLLKSLVDANFKDKKPLIKVSIVQTDDFMARMRMPYFSNRFPMLLSKEDVEQMNDFALTGLLMHELCHIKQWMALSLPERIIDRFVFQLNVTKRERETDKMVIKLGYGQQLLAFQRYHDKYYEAYDKTDGLTKKEIKKIVKSRKN